MDPRPARRAGADLNSNSNDMEFSGLHLRCIRHRPLALWDSNALQTPRIRRRALHHPDNCVFRLPPQTPPARVCRHARTRSS